MSIFLGDKRKFHIREEFSLRLVLLLFSYSTLLFVCFIIRLQFKKNSAWHIMLFCFINLIVTPEQFKKQVSV